MEFKVHSFDTLVKYRFVDILAIYKNKWIFCMHKERTTWENPGGHIEPEETLLEAAKRELYEETGAVDFNMEPLCDYYLNGEMNGVSYSGNGQVYYALVHTLGELPQYSEMEKIGLFDALPDELTYPVLRNFFHLGMEKHFG